MFIESELNKIKDSIVGYKQKIKFCDDEVSG